MSDHERALNEVLEAARIRYENATHAVHKAVADTNTACTVEENAMAAYFAIKQAVEKVTKPEAK